MAIQAGEQIRIFVQTRDGMVTDLTGYVTSFSMLQSLYGEVDVDITIRGSHAPFLYSDMDKFVEDKIEKPIETGMWVCDYCGTHNSVWSNYCGQEFKETVGCGARKPFYVVDVSNKKQRDKDEEEFYKANRRPPPPRPEPRPLDELLW